MLAFLATLVGAVIADAAQGRSQVTEFYTKARSLVPSEGWVPMEGRGVVWWVEPGEAVWIEARYLLPTSGNPFDGEQLGAVADGVEQGGVELYAAFGDIDLITPGEVAESIRGAEDLDGDPWTTGDEDLDEWLADPREALELWEDIDLAVNFKMWSEGKDPDRVQEMLDRLESMGRYDPGSELFLEATGAGYLADFKRDLAHAVATRQGDLGHWTAYLRDGNHRAFGAVLGGEEAVAVRVAAPEIDRLQRSLIRGDGSPGQHPLLAKMIEDTGHEPDWLERILKGQRARAEPLIETREIGPRDSWKAGNR